jgi:hypothetical protein
VFRRGQCPLVASVNAGAVRALLSAGQSSRWDQGDRLVIGRDTGDDPPASVTQLKDLLGAAFPQVELAEAVIAIDAVCEFSRHLLHAGGAASRSPAMLVHLYRPPVVSRENHRSAPFTLVRSFDRDPWAQRTKIVGRAVTCVNVATR